MHRFEPVLLSLLLIAAPIFGDNSWCQVQSQYCGNSEHIACRPNSFVASQKCQNVRLIPLTLQQKGLIVSRHNEYRKQIASGLNSKFPAAQQMGVMRWDETLQLLAETHVRHCTFEHDQCRATPEYPQAGQNLFSTSSAGVTPNATAALLKGIDSWFEEWKVAHPSMLDKFEAHHLNAGHFSVMVNDRNNRLGCGMISYNVFDKGYKWDAFMLTCNYQGTNMLGQPVYRRGVPCSGCKSTCSSIFKGLCDTWLWPVNA